MSQEPIIFSLFGNKILPPTGELILHTFPDKETVIEFKTLIKNREIIFIDSLNNPNEKILPLIFAAQTARDLGATKITLIAPYLAYMRQDKVFEIGQGITSTYFAKILSTYFDRLITVDPHLHRWHALSDIYTIPATAVHANALIANWIQQHVERPILIGPDAESEQWVKAIATEAKAPFVILEKTRKGDRNIEVSIPQIEHYQSHIPVLVDDIISTGVTLMGTINHLKTLQMKPPVCIGVHAVFSDNAYEDLLQTGIASLITCNTIPHPSNAINVYEVITKALYQ
jgi:ribose-phosphate pyrophosphokinase